MQNKNDALTLIIPMVGIALGLGTAIAATAMSTQKDLKKEDTKQLEMELQALREEREAQMNTMYQKYGISIPD